MASMALLSKKQTFPPLALSAWKNGQLSCSLSVSLTCGKPAFPSQANVLWESICQPLWKKNTVSDKQLGFIKHRSCQTDSNSLLWQNCRFSWQREFNIARYRKALGGDLHKASFLIRKHQSFSYQSVAQININTTHEATWCLEAPDARFRILKVQLVAKVLGKGGSTPRKQLEDRDFLQFTQDHSWKVI